MPLRRFLECNFGVSYREKNQNQEIVESKGGKKKGAKKTEKEIEKERVDEEDRKGFSMQGKPYKEKFKGQRISKVGFTRFMGLCRLSMRRNI